MLVILSNKEVDETFGAAGSPYFAHAHEGHQEVVEAVPGLHMGVYACVVFKVRFVRFLNCTVS